MASTGAQTGIYEIPGTLLRNTPISLRVNASPAVDGNFDHFCCHIAERWAPQLKKSCIMSKNFLPVGSVSKSLHEEASATSSCSQNFFLVCR